MSDRGDSRTDRCDAPAVLIAVGRQIEKLGLVMRKHRLVPEQQICVCGRIATRLLLPAFGLRCDIVGEQWDLAQESIRRVCAQMSGGTHTTSRAVGRARPPSRPTR